MPCRRAQPSSTASGTTPLAVRNEIPSIGYVTFAEAGGLIGYGVDWFAI
jgi:hypothetical protein